MSGPQIALPVKAMPGPGDAVEWQLNDARGWIVAKRLTEVHAEQIAFALNMHNDLLAFVIRCAEQTQGLHFHYKRRGETFTDPIDRIATEILARAETANETET